MDHEIRRGRGVVVEVLRWEGPAWTFGDDAAQAQREALTKRAIARAFELRGLAYERRNPGWLESDHNEFACREVSDDEIAVTTPVGTFRLAAHRARAGELKTAFIQNSVGTGFGARATEDQDSPPVTLCGRLNPPSDDRGGWTFQPSCFVYADGTSSDWLGAYPRDIRWEVEPDWPL